MPAQAIALIAIKTVTTKGNIMKKYPINKDFDLIKFLTFPVIAQATPIARGVHGMLVNEHHGDKYIKVSKSKIEVKGGKIDVLVFELFNTIGTMHGFDMAAKSKIVIESIGRRTDFLRRCFR